MATPTRSRHSFGVLRFDGSVRQMEPMTARALVVVGHLVGAVRMVIAPVHRPLGLVLRAVPDLVTRLDLGLQSLGVRLAHVITPLHCPENFPELDC